MIRELETCKNQEGRNLLEFLQSLDNDFVETLSIAVDRMSIYVLDSLNISAGKVRRRATELLNTTLHMTRKQAFFQAVIEEVERMDMVERQAFFRVVTEENANT